MNTTMIMNDGSYLTNANWRHLKTGETYHIMGLSTRESDGVTLVHYANTQGGEKPVWTRPAHEFFDGRFIRLFPGIVLPKDEL